MHCRTVSARAANEWSRSYLDAVQDGRAEDVDTGIDAVANKLFRLLLEAFDDRRRLALEDDTEFAGILDLGDLDPRKTGVSELAVGS